MHLFRLGKTRPSLPELTSATPPYMVDGLIVTDEEGLNEEEQSLLAYYRRHGRPVGSSSADLEGLPRTNYQPIDCNFYDNFEAAIVRRRVVVLEYRKADGTIERIATRLQDLKTHLTEEYVQLVSGEWLRLDRIVSVDGARLPFGPDAEQEASCRF